MMKYQILLKGVRTQSGKGYIDNSKMIGNVEVTTVFISWLKPG